MTISIWIIFFVLIAVGLIFYYKKNRYKIKAKENNLSKKKKLDLNNLDKMIENLTEDQEEDMLKSKQNINDNNNSQL